MLGFVHENHEKMIVQSPFLESALKFFFVSFALSVDYAFLKCVYKISEITHYGIDILSAKPIDYPSKPTATLDFVNDSLIIQRVCNNIGCKIG
jgi:hypothetical protein